MENIDEIKELFIKYNEILRCKRRIPITERRLTLELAQLKTQEALVEKELLDVIQLQQFSLKFLFIKYLRNYEEQLKKENQEYLMAALAYNENLKVIESIKYELELLHQKAENETFVKKSLEVKLSQIEESTLFAQSSFLAEYKSITQGLNDLLRMKIEIDDAVGMIDILKGCFHQLIDNLQQAKKFDNWGEFYEEKLRGRRLNKEHIDLAEIQIVQLEKALTSLKEELTDIKEIKEVFKRSTILIRGFNLLYYENLIIDWIGGLNLSNTLALSRNRSQSIDGLTIILKGLKKNVENEYQIHDKQRELLIEKITQTN